MIQGPGPLPSHGSTLLIRPYCLPHVVDDRVRDIKYLDLEVTQSSLFIDKN